MSAPVLMPVTSLKRGRVPVWVQPHKMPAPKAPSAPPPDRASTYISGSSFPWLAAFSCSKDSMALCSKLLLCSSPHARTPGNPGICT